MRRSEKVCTEKNIIKLKLFTDHQLFEQFIYKD